MAVNGITVLKHNVPWGPFTRAQIDDGLARGDFTLKYLAHAPGLNEWLPLGEVLDYQSRREGSAALPPIPDTRDLPAIPERPVVVVPPPAPVAESRPVLVREPAPSPPILPAPPPRKIEPVAQKPQAPPAQPAPAPQASTSPEPEGAPFFLRAIAFLVDCGVIFSPVVLLFVLGILSIYVPTWFHRINPQTLSEERGLLWHNTRRMAGLLAIGCGWLYAAWYESSRDQATIGKRWMRLKVVDEENERISFARATGRYLAKYISALPCFLGFLMALFSSRGRALHDRLAGTRVVRD